MDEEHRTHDRCTQDLEDQSVEERVHQLQNAVSALAQEVEKLKENQAHHPSEPQTLADTPFFQRLGVDPWPTNARNGARFGWDSLVDPWIDLIPKIGDKIPSAYRIWQTAHRYYIKGDTERAGRAERLNYLLHNSYVPAALELRGEVIFGYGGIGVIVHPLADICEFVTIGANVTIGGNGGGGRLDERTGKRTTVPRIEPLTTIGACANVTGGIVLAPMTIVAPNAVVTKSTTPGEIVGGVPFKHLGQVTRSNALKYKAKYLPARHWTDDEYMEKVEQLLPS
ncbi:MAG: hypothetical protein SPI12_03440 [Actinomycetaceae bacterium]|nr:hypothetical protein [Actinomycetaceae bacterium]MDY6082900.1 hypothetical protein [Actinomycetaceae bacterium]